MVLICNCKEMSTRANAILLARRWYYNGELEDSEKDRTAVYVNVNQRLPYSNSYFSAGVNALDLQEVKPSVFNFRCKLPTHEQPLDTICKHKQHI